MMRLSDGSLIDDWQRPAEIIHVEPPPADPAVILAERIVLAVNDLKEALAALPAPQVHVAAPDLAEVTSAVLASIPQGVDPELIGLAVAKALKFPEPTPTDNTDLVEAIKEAFAKLDHSMKGNRPAFGASGPSNISDNANRQLGRVTIDGETAVTGPLTNAELRASAPAVKDDYQGGECLPEQVGAGAVLTFTFTTPVQMVHVEGNGLITDVARVDPFGGTPSATLGFRAGDEVGLYLPVTTSEVKVFAPTGMVIAVNGFRRV